LPEGRCSYRRTEEEEEEEAEEEEEEEREEDTEQEEEEEEEEEGEQGEEEEEEEEEEEADKRDEEEEGQVEDIHADSTLVECLCSTPPCLADGVHAVAQPLQAQRVELPLLPRPAVLTWLKQEIGAHLARQQRDVLDDGQPHAPVDVLRQVLAAGSLRTSCRADIGWCLVSALVTGAVRRVPPHTRKSIPLCPLPRALLQRPML